MAEKYNFFAVDSKEYENSELHKVLKRIDFIVNTYVREFSSQSIDDWVGFLKAFLNSNGSVKRFNCPLIILQLSVEHPTKTKKNNANGVVEGTIVFKPNIAKASKFILECID